MKIKRISLPIIATLVAGFFVMVAPVAAEAATGATILANWSDAFNRPVFVRIGTYDGVNGFGMSKIQKKHNIYWTASLKFVTANPNGGTKQGDDRLYLAYANRKVCSSSGTCTYTTSIPVRVVMSNVYAGTYYGVVVNGAIGIKTAYCITDTAATDCPAWVDEALSNIAARTATPAPETVWSYTPLGATP
ncbi:MAG: hypothetical protein V4531_05590 [Actinomycetota bacterium]